MREEHGTTIYADPESVSAEASTKTLPAVKPHATNQSDHEEVEYIPRSYDSSGEATTEEDMPGHGQSRGTKTVGVAGYAKYSAQRSSSLETSKPRQYLGRVDALGIPSQGYPVVIILFIYSIEQIFPSICSFCYALRSQSLKLYFPSQLHLFG